MKKLIQFLLVALLACPLSAAEWKKELPAAKGKGESVLLLNGGRPWVGGETLKPFLQVGLRVTLLGSEHLAGFGGAPLRFYLPSKEEPDPKDGITPAFEQLSNYKLVIVNAIPTDMQLELFTPERVAALQQYVQNGGHLLLTRNCPASLGELLPATPGALIHGNGTITRPEGEMFAFLPESWPMREPFRLFTVCEGATVSGEYVSENGTDKAPLFIQKKYGDGLVTIWNGSFERIAGMCQTYEWAYGRALFLAASKYAGELNIQPEAVLRKVADISAPRKQQSTLSVKITADEPEFTKDTRPAKVTDNGDGTWKAEFVNGVVITSKKNGVLTVTAPDCPAAPKNMAPLSCKYTAGETALDAATAEAAGSGAKQRTEILSMTLLDAKPIEGGASFRYQLSDGTELAREFSLGQAKLDPKRILSGIGERIVVTKSPRTWERIGCKRSIPVVAGLRGKCFSCYTPPRGWKDVDFSVSGDASIDTWNFFANGQPFVYWSVPEVGIRVEFTDGLQPIFVSQHKASGARNVITEHEFVLGRQQAPFATAWYWSCSGKLPEKDNNVYLGIWQLVRKTLRKNANLLEIPARPCALYQNLCTTSQIEKSADAAKELGFRQVFLPLCPTQLEKTFEHEAFRIMASRGLTSFPWTAADYTHSKEEIIFKNDAWLIYTFDNKRMMYFNQHYVVDLNNPEFRKWYEELFTRGIEEKISGVYMDMGGCASLNVNYRGKTAEPGLNGLIDRFRFLQQHGVQCSVEGFNPLILDMYWYRQSLYTPMEGKEFALLGAQLASHLPGDDIALDYFRCAMYGCFPLINVDGYALNFERTPGEIASIKRIGKLNPAIQRALDVVGMPYIQEFAAGTIWTSPRGAAIFCRDGVDKLQLQLPENWQIIEGKTEGITPDSIIIIKGDK